MHFLTGAHQLSLPFPQAPERGVSFLRHGARRFAQRRGREYSAKGLDQLQADSQMQARVAQRYETQAVVPDHRVKRAYAALAAETHEQYNYLTTPRIEGGLGVTVEFHDTDPYKDHNEMTADVQKNRRLKVLKSSTTGGAPHAFLDEDTNDKFRAVHDAWGHAAIGRSFSRHGEEAAFHSHAQMYSPQALPALVTETRAQNSALNYGSNPGTFAEQKPIVLPQWAAKSRLRRDRPAGPSGTTKVS